MNLKHQNYNNMKIRDIILTNSGDTTSFNSLINSGFILHHFPMIEISYKEIRPFSLDKYDFYVFTSKNGVDSFFNAPFIKVQYEKKISTVCLGQKTAKKIREFGVFPTFISNSNYSNDLFKELSEKGFLEKKKVLLVQGDLASDYLLNNLKNICSVDRVNSYSTHIQEYLNIDLNNIIKNNNSISIFSSPSSFEGFAKFYDMSKTNIVSIGKTTTNYIKSKGGNPIITSKNQNFESLSEEIINYFNLDKINL